MAQPDSDHAPDVAANVEGPNDNESSDTEFADDYALFAPYEIAPAINNEPEARLSRFLYVGKEILEYRPGYWFVHNYFLVKNVPSIEELAAIPEKQLVPVQLITKAFENNLVPHPETLVFALAVCCRQTISEKLRNAAYKSVAKICTTTEQFISFVRFTSKLKRENELCYSTFGWGQGMKNAVNNWYMSQEPLALAKCVTKYKGRFGWKHKDIIKLSHTLGNTPEQAVILKYVIQGLSKAQRFASELARDDNTVEAVIEYINKIENFKHEEDEGSAASQLQELHLSLEHVPGHFLKSTNIWLALISSMDIATLLKNLQRMHSLYILDLNEGVDRTVELLCNEELIAREKIHPAQIFIALVNYQFGKPLSLEKKKIQETAKKPKLHFAPNHKVLAALEKTFYASFAHLKRTNLRYLVTIGLGKKMMCGRAWQCANMTAFDVGCLIAMTLVRQETDVTVATVKNHKIIVSEIDNEETFEQVGNKLHHSEDPSSAPYKKLGKPLLWAMKMKKEYDVFINIVDQVLKLDKSQECLSMYRNVMKLPEAKLINCAVCASSTLPCDKNRKPHDKSVLFINGFDATVPLIIQAFVQSLF